MVPRDQDRARIYTLDSIPEAFRSALAKAPIGNLTLATTNIQKMRSLAPFMPVPMTHVSGALVVPPEENAQTLEGNLDEKLRALVQLISKSPFWERRLNLVHSKGYITDEGYAAAHAAYAQAHQECQGKMPLDIYQAVTDLLADNPAYFRNKPAASPQAIVDGVGTFRHHMLSANHAYIADDSQLSFLYGEGHPKAGQAISIRDFYKAAYEHSISVPNLTNALLSVVAEKIAAREVDSSTQPLLHTNSRTMPELLRALDQLIEKNPEYDTLPGPDGADLYKNGFHDVMSDIIRVFDAMNANPVARSESIVSLVIEKPDGSLMTWTDEDTQIQSAIRIKAEQVNTLLPAGTLLDPTFKMRYVEDVLAGTVVYPRSEIMHSLIDAAAMTPVNNRQLRVSVMLPDGMTEDNPYKQAVTRAVTQRGHTPVFFQFKDIDDPVKTKPILDNFGLSIVLHPKCFSGLSKNAQITQALAYNQIAGLFADHRLIGSNDRRTIETIFIAPSLESPNYSPAYWLGKTAHIGAAGESIGVSMHFLSNTSQNMPIVLRDLIGTLEKNAFVRYQATRQPIRETLSLLQYADAAPSFQPRDNTYPVLPVYYIGSASSPNLAPLNLAKATITAIQNWASTRGIVLDSHHGGGCHSHMALFSEAHQVFDIANLEKDGKSAPVKLVVGSSGVTTKILLDLEGGGEMRAAENVLTEAIHQRMSEIFLARPGMEKAPMVVVADHGGNGTVDEIIFAIRHAKMTGRDIHFLITSPWREYRNMVQEICQKSGLPEDKFIHISGKEAKEAGLDLSDASTVPAITQLIAPRLAATLDDVITRNQANMPYLTLEEITKRLPATLMIGKEGQQMLNGIYGNATPLVLSNGKWPVHLEQLHQGNDMNYLVPTALLQDLSQNI